MPRYTTGHAWTGALAAMVLLPLVCAARAALPAPGAGVALAEVTGQYLPRLREATEPGALPDWTREALLTLCEAEATLRDRDALARHAEAGLASAWEMLRQAQAAGDGALAHALRREVTTRRLALDEAIAQRDEAARARDDARAAFDRALQFNPSA
jgi:hypothetical protein